MQNQGSLQPMSTANNDNQSKYNTKKAPKRYNKIKLKHKKYDKKKLDNTQSAIINSLQKKVYQLQMDKFGPFQQALQRALQAFSPSATQPICFNLVDFTAQAPNSPTGAQIWQHSGGSNTPITYFSHDPLLANNLYWKDQNQDIVGDGGRYYAHSATYFIQVKGNRNLKDTRIRFDMVAQKPESILQAQVSASPALLLPNSLGELKHLAEPIKNRINPVYFKKYYSKTLCINSKPASDSDIHPTTNNLMRFSFKIRPKRVITNKITSPVTGTDANVPALPTGVTSYGPGQMSVTNPLWMIVSTDDASGGDRVEIEVSRRVCWRDTLGSANI